MKVLGLHVYNSLEVMHEKRGGNELKLNHPQLLVGIISCQSKITIHKSDWTNLSRIEKNGTEIVRSNASFVDIVRKTLSCSL